jgi:hypothetical protein
MGLVVSVTPRPRLTSKNGKIGLELVGVQEVTSDNGGSEPAGIHSSMAMRMRTVTEGQASPYIQELYQRLRRRSLLTIGYYSRYMTL